jgi:class 3 adenylate cyclase
MPTVMQGSLTGRNLYRSGEHRQFDGTALFIDVRRSSEIVRHIERHHGAGSAAVFFMRYLTGCMEAVTSQTEAKCQPSGDAVLAIIEGQDRVSRAMKAAAAAIRFVESTFEPENRDLLSCNGRCRRGFHSSHRHSCHTMHFEVGIGVDDGIITESSLSSNYGDSQELVGSCVSLAAKLSDYRKAANAVALTSQTYRNVNRDQLLFDRRHRHIMKLGGQYRIIRVAHPSLP